MSNIAIRVDHLGKRYRLRHEASRPPYRTLREDLLDLPQRAWRAWRSSHRTTTEEFWALRDVSFEVKTGEVLGIIGRNGAGKSTLLKMLSRIVDPTTGAADIFGRVGSLLEVGTGFHPELTGRENIFLSGALLGMRRAEVRRRFDEIVAFAEVEKFIDTPCKHYSSGMFLRLGFAVAAHLDAEILVVDEVLAVGDAQFQKKCLSKMEAVTNLQGRTVLFVSHNLAAIKQLCSRALYLQEGKLVAQGSTDEVMQRYAAGLGGAQTELVRQLAPQTACGIESVRINGVWTADQSGFAYGHPMQIEIGVHAVRPLRTLQVAVRVSSVEGVPVFTTSNFDHLRQSTGLGAGRHRFRVSVPPLLAAGRYTLVVALCDPQRETFDVVQDRVGFSIDGVGSLLMDLNDGRRGCVEWSLPWEHQTLP